MAALASESVQVFNIRPGYFFPSNSKDATQVRSAGSRFADKPLRPTLNTLAPSLYIKIEDLARFALEAGKGRAEPGTISNAGMRALLAEWKSG